MSVHSYLVCDMSATRSPACTPAAMNPLARACTSSLNWLAVTSPQVPSADLRRSMTALGCSAARRVTTWAVLAFAGISARAGMLYSRKDLSVSSRTLFISLLLEGRAGRDRQDEESSSTRVYVLSHEGPRSK